MPTDRGVIYQLTGSRMAVHLAVSIWSLRKHYKGPVTIFATEDCWPIASCIAADDDLDVRVAETELISGCHKRNFVAKAWTYLLSPYEHSIYLDCDTVISAPIDELFRQDFGVCQINKVKYNDDNRAAKMVRRWMENWNMLGPVCKSLLAQVKTDNVPLINNGMLAFRRFHPVLWEMHHLTLAGKNLDLLGDNLALQLMLAYREDITILPDKWNCCVAYSDPTNAVITHYHGQRWRSRSRFRKQWYNYLMTAIKNDVGNLKSWAKRYNPAVTDLIENGPDSKPLEMKRPLPATPTED